MHPHGLGPAKGPIQMAVQRKGAQPFRAPQHMGDAHQVVVHYHRQVIRGQAVGLEQHEVVDVFVGYGDVAADEVVHGDAAFAGGFEAHHVRLARGNPAFGLVEGNVSAAAVVAGRLFLAALLGPQFGQAFGRAKAVVRVALLDQLFRVGAIEMRALGLAVRPIRPALVGAFIPFQAQPAQVVHEILLGLGHEAFAVGVFDAQDELTAGLAGQQEVVQRGPRATDVQIAGGRGRKPHAGGRGGRLSHHGLLENGSDAGGREAAAARLYRVGSSGRFRRSRAALRVGAGRAHEGQEERMRPGRAREKFGVELGA